jgi:hypothetical protein
MEATSPSYLLTRLVYVPQSPSTYLKIRPRPHTLPARILFSHNHSLADSRPFLHPNFSPSVRIPCGRLPASTISSDPSPSSPFHLALRVITASVLGTRNQYVSPPHQLIELPAQPDAAA